MLNWLRKLFGIKVKTEVVVEEEIGCNGMVVSADKKEQGYRVIIKR